MMGSVLKSSNLPSIFLSLQRETTGFDAARAGLKSLGGFMLPSASVERAPES